MTEQHASYPPVLPFQVVQSAVLAALAEDLGQAGDVTSQATIGPDAKARAQINARQDGVICGLVARAAFDAVGPGQLQVEVLVPDGGDGGFDGAGQCTGPAGGRAHSAQFHGASERNCDVDASVRGLNNRHRRTYLLHAQNDTRPAGGGEICG